MNRTVVSSPLLRLALRLDALLSIAAGALTTTLAEVVAAEIGVPTIVTTTVGLLLLGYGVLVGTLGIRERLVRWLVRLVVIGNSIWALDSLLLFATGWISPSTVGIALIVAQAMAVGSLAALQERGLRRSAAAPA